MVIFIYLLLDVFFDAAQIGYVFRLSLSHEFEQFETLHMCAARKYMDRSGTQTRYFRALSQPRYKGAIPEPQYE